MSATSGMDMANGAEEIVKEVARPFAVLLKKPNETAKELKRLKKFIIFEKPQRMATAESTALDTAASSLVRERRTNARLAGNEASRQHNLRPVRPLDIVRGLSRGLITNQPRKNMKRHVDARGNAGRTHDAAIVDDALIALHRGVGCDGFEQVIGEPVCRCAEPFEQTGLGEYERSGAYRQHEFSLRGRRADVGQHIGTIQQRPRADAAGNEQNLGLWRSVHGVIGIHAESIDRSNGPGLGRD